MKFDENSLEENLEKSLEQLLNDSDFEPQQPEQKTEVSETPVQEKPVQETSAPEKPQEQQPEQPELPVKQPTVIEEPEEHLSMDQKIDLAMKKIMVETLGELPEEEEEPAPKKRKGSWKTKTAGILCSLFLVLGIGAYCVYAYTQKDVLFQGTHINQVDCGGLTVEETENLIRQKIENYTLKLGFRNGQNETISGKDIGVAYVSDGKIQEIKDSQNPLLWIKGYFSPESHEVAEKFTFDKAKLKSRLESFSTMKKSNMESPQNATVFFENGAFTIKEEVPGTTLKTESVYRAVSEALSGGQTELNLDTEEFYMGPAVRKEDSLLHTQQQQLNELAKASITYQLPNGESLVLDGNLMKEWLNQDMDGNYVKEDAVFNSHLRTFVSDLAKKYNTYGQKRKFKPTGLSEMEIEGNYGWKIDEAKELEKLKENIANQETVTREPEYSHKEASGENYGFGKSYIEVDLSRQHVWAYVDGEQVVSSDCVSGKMIKSRWTPPGIFNLRYKVKDTVLKGQPLPGGGYEYESPVAFWMPFNNGIGFHDADGWRSSYGGKIYVNGGSHGCINMPRKNAEKLYEIIKKDMPIIVYYSEEYTVKEDPPKPSPTPTPAAAPQS